MTETRINPDILTNGTTMKKHQDTENPYKCG